VRISVATTCARWTTPPRQSSCRFQKWRKPALFAAAAIILLATFFGWRRRVFQTGASLADYRDEMVSFIRIDPPLELETNDFSRIKSFLQKSGAPSEANMPPAMQKLPLFGCRTLRFRGHDVALICFNQGDGRVAHLLVIDRARSSRPGCQASICHPR
jgi:hypothetical protein